MEKLRAAAPQTRATREQRRRARLKDKHQVRVASGQQIPETGENVELENGLLSPTRTEFSEEGGIAEEKDGAGGVSEGEDIADRAANLLQGLRGDGEGGLSEAPSRDESLRVRRRRESADDERARRRARRRGGGGSTDAGAAAKERTITEEGELSVDTPTSRENGPESRRSSGERQLPTPTTVVVPPSPTTSERNYG